MTDEHADSTSRANGGTQSSPADPTPTPAVATTAPRPNSSPSESGAPSAPAPEPAEPNEGAPPAPKRRRRRGSRGGRNRRKSGTAAAGSAAARAVSAPLTDDDDLEDTTPDDTDAAADRGLTSEDLALDAKEDAGLVPDAAPQVGATRPAPPRPRIGDTRPAPRPAGPAGVPGGNGDDGARSGDGARSRSRRRRRGGRGRGRGGAGGGGGAGATIAGNAEVDADTAVIRDVVRADLGVGDALDVELDEDALERRRGRTRKGRPAGRYFMCIHVRGDGHNHIAVLEGRSLVEHYVTTPRDDDMSIDGNIYLGRVQNVLPGMEAAFVDIGTPKNGVLYRGDVSFDPSEVESKQPRIEQLLKNGQNVLVQVTKNPIGAKGARLTQEVSLAGRFVVLVPNQPQTYGISKRMPDDERKRLRKVLDHVRPDDAGLIVRTAAEGATAEELERDVVRLRQQWNEITALARRSRKAGLLYQEPPLALRLLREEFTKEYRGVALDDRGLYEEIKAYVDAMAPELTDRVEYYDAHAEGLPLFERYHVHEQLVKALDRKVWLPSGGSLIIERTEALTVIDANTGKNVGRSNLEETVYRNNLEAAEEVARQLRLRDIGGIIVIDFIDMETKGNRDEVMRLFRDALARDKTRTQVFDISELGLVEMTRKRVSEGLLESVSSLCETCQGRGFLIDQALLHDLD
jgi:ribonuclease E